VLATQIYNNRLAIPGEIRPKTSSPQPEGHKPHLKDRPTHYWTARKVADESLTCWSEGDDIELFWEEDTRRQEPYQPPLGHRGVIR
jgi:hypothetical protein